MTPRRVARSRRPAWSRLWRAELHRLISLRGQWVLLTLAAVSALGLGVGQLLALKPADDGTGALRAIASGADISPFFIGLGAALFTAADLSSRQFALTLLQVNKRLLVFGAKVTVLTGGAVVTAFAALVWLVPMAAARGADFGPDSISRLIVIPALHVFFALLGAAIGMIARSVVGAVFIYLAIIWALPLVAAVAGIWLPSVAGPVLQIAPVTLTAGMLEMSSQLDALTKFAILDGVLLALGAVLVHRWRIR